ncbi:MAG TPA: glutathione S-transferase family protein [Alphaproteobacteria bacterium]|nr:glutathione S-transferase family protein [Alphaproteobacteria bacterium]
MKLYWAPRTRSIRILWMLEETGCAYERVLIDIWSGAQASSEYHAINPMEKMPALVDGDATVAESAAICAYIADRYPAAGLAPSTGDAARGRYLQWLFFSAGCVEPAYMEKVMGWKTQSTRAGWGDFDRVIGVLEDALAQGEWILGDRFSAADVMLGGVLHYGLNILKIVEPRPAIEAYVARCAARPALQRALAIEAEAVGA